MSEIKKSKVLKSGLSILLALTIIFSSAYVGLSEVDFGIINFNGINQFIKKLIPDFSVESQAASSGTCGDNLTWSLDDNGTMTISGTGDMESYNYYSRAPWESQVANIKSVVIENGVTSIGGSAFEYCENLTSVTISDSVVEIGEAVFSGSTNLTSVIIPTGVTNISYRAFYCCYGLTEINVAESNVAYSSVDGVLFNKDKTVLVCYPQGKTNTEYAIPDGVKNIDRHSFEDCENLVMVTIPDSVTTISSGAFFYCTGLTTLTIPDSVIAINGDAFYYCRSLTTLTIGSGVTSIGEEAFYGCDNIKSVYITNLDAWWGLEFSEYSGTPDWFETADLYINGELVTNIVIPDDITTINKKVFWGNKNIKNITIPHSITDLGDAPFSKFPNLTSISVDENNINYCSVDGVLFNKDKTTLLRYPQSKANTEYSIPDGVTCISASAFENCANITMVTIPDSVTEIAYNAFRNCSNLESVTIPDSVTTIGTFAFYYCKGLTTLTIGSGVTSIAENAFYSCDSINAIYITNFDVWCSFDFSEYSSLPVWFYTADLYIDGELATDIVFPDGLTTLKENVFLGCKNVETVTIPASLTNVGESPFDLCLNLKSITVDKDNPVYSSIDGILFNKEKTTLIKYPPKKETAEYIIPNSVMHVGATSFMGCDVLTSVIIPEGVVSIGDYAFYDCSILTKITIPDSIKRIGRAVFHYTGYYSDENNWKNGVLYLDNCLVAANSEIVAGDFVVKNGTKAIGSYAFMSCANLTSVTIPEGVVSIGDYAFYSCTGLTSITLPSTVEHLGAYSFMVCENLETVTILGGADIGYSAFHYCENLKTFTMGEGKSSIGDHVFVECPNLTTVTIGEGATSIGRDAFNGCSNLVNLTIPDSVEFIGEYAFYCGYMEDEKNWENGVLYIGKHLLMANPEEVSGIYEIKTGTKTIGSRAFMGCEMLTGVVIPDSVKSICSYAFYETMLISVVIPDGVKTLGEGAFYYCPYLRSVTIPDSVTSLGVSVFAACPSLSSISIPDSITVIPENAFVGSGIQEVVLTKNIVSIGEGAFDGCENLTAVFYGGSQADWQKMEIGTDNEYLLEAGLHYNATGHTMVDGTCSVCGYALWEYELYDDYAVITGYLGVEANVVIPDTIEGLPVTEIASGAFTERTSVVSVTVGNNVTKICDQAFLFCLALKSVTLPESLTEIGSVAFSYCLELEEILIPENVSVIGLGALAYCPKLKNIQVDSENKNFASEDGILFNKEKTALVSYPIGKESKTYNIPENVKVIGDAAFTMCKLEKIIIPETVESINSYVFMESTALKSIVISGKETTIGEESIDSSTTVYCYENSVVHEYVVANSLDYVLINLHSIDCDVVVDYENELIFSYADLCSDYTEIISSSTDYDIHVRESFSADAYKYYGTGTKVAILDGEDIIEEFMIITVGDTNGDSVCDVIDCFDVERASNGNAELTGAYAMAADSNTDDIVDINDYQSIVNKALAS